MNLCSKVLILVCLVFASVPTWALNVKALYTAACKRNLGLILDINDDNITFLSMDKSVITIPRYEIIYMADYPVDILPTRGTLSVASIPFVQVNTLSNHRENLLLRGWPIGFNAEKIAFLKKNGGETVIDSKNIWSLSFDDKPQDIRSHRRPKDYRFIHPYAFRKCSYAARGRKIYPQQILSDPVQIKRDLDALQKGFNRIRRYEREQDFYPIPQVYENKTELGIWFSFGSRSGASEKRTNNFLPLLVDQYSSDIFDYQHISITGSAPLLEGTHEEPQSQIYYHFKASYFHFSIMVDPDLVLVGENYEWQAGDFDTGKPDVRHNDTTIVELGFDFGNFSLRAYGGSVLNLGVWDGTTIIPETFGFPRFGVKYSNHRWWGEINGGSGAKKLDNNSGELNLSFTRLNLGFNDFMKMDIVYSLILSSFQADQLSNLKSDGTTHAVYASYPLTKRLRLGSFLSLESKSTSTTSLSNDESFIKGGASLFVNF